MTDILHLINFDFIIKLTAAIAFGFCIGLERELTNKYAGLRTHILVCLGACIFTLISIYGFPTFAFGDNVVIDHATGIRDTSRVAAQIVTGIGFIGAGTVLRNGPIVLGLTTAATLWISASVGMACGAGMLDIAFYGTVISVLTLVIIRVFEQKLLPNSTKRSKRVKITFVCKNEKVEALQDYIMNKYDNLIEFTNKPLATETTSTKISITIDLKMNKTLKDIYKFFEHKDGIESISIQELFE